MPMPRAELHQWILRTLDEVNGSPIGDLPSSDSDTPVSTTANWLDDAIDQAILYVILHCYPVAGRATLNFGTGPRLIRLSTVDAYMDTATANDGSKFRFLTDLFDGTTRVKEYKWSYLKGAFPDYRIQTGTTAKYWYRDSDENDTVGVYPNLTVSKSLLAHGYVYPPSIAYGPQTLDWMPREEVRRLILPFAAAYTAFKNISHTYMKDRMQGLQTDFDNAVAERFTHRVSPMLKEMGVIVPPPGIEKQLQQGG